MRLKKLEVKGFKSFARPTVINFSENVTGVVGPNGSGKSNIVDAIRWVLGEQKTTGLRLEKMGDVIFNGTKQKKAAKLASVSITFLNDKGILPSEYHEVTVTRQLFRNGHSEYRLNGVVCRLKDIQTLLVDTGISSNSYAIIELKMIDDILADKDQSRRYMFEQAAGISKFKHRKKETERKLKATLEDLDRVEDLLFEIRGNLKSLERQARKAKRYLKLKDEYKFLSIQLAVHQLESYKSSYESLKKEIAAQQDEYHKFSAQINNREADLEREKEQHLGKESALTELQKSLNNLIQELRGLENNIHLAQREIQLSEQSLEREIQRKKEDSSKKLAWEGQIDQLDARIASAAQKYRASKEMFDLLDQDRSKVEDSHAGLKEAHQALINEQLEVEKGIFSLEKSLALIENDITNAYKEIELLEAERSKAESNLTHKKREKEETSWNVLERARLAGELEAEQDKLEQHKQELEERLHQLRDQQGRVGRQLDALENEYSLTKSMVDSLEGYPESIKFLSKKKDWQKLAVLFSDILDVEESYKSAIENYLDPFLNYYVVEEMSTALDGIQHLRNAQKGRAHFFVLEALGGFDTTPSVKGLIPAYTLVKSPGVYESLVRELLYKVYIAPDPETIDFTEIPKDLTVIAADGRFIKSGKRISGGSVGLFDGKKLGRKINLEKLRKSIDKKESELDRIRAEKQEVKKQLEHLVLGHDRDKMALLRQEIEHWKMQDTRLQAEIENDENRIATGEERLKKIRARIEKLEESSLEKQGELDELMEAEDSVKSRMEQSSGQLEEISESLREASKEHNARHVETIRLQNTVESLANEKKYIASQLEELHKSAAEREDLIRKYKQTIVQNKEQIEAWNEKQVGLYDQKKSLEVNLSDSEQAYFAARKVIQDIEKEINSLNHNQRQTQSLINQLKDKYHDIKMQMMSISQRANVEFNISADELTGIEKDPDVPSEGLDEKVEKLRNRLFNFGEVNPLAVEAYDEMEERYNGIVEQKDDILNAKYSLEQTITELEASATEKFMEAFEKVREHFIHIFRHLFSEGDTCDLVLLDETNPLESRIEIIAKPKGKRPLSLSQLSGGEKTLTATALLFALYLLKPAPFCIFDEVDAPLDDANIQKFNKIINKFARDSQFVIITHNKLTMVAVDVIYGIYMDEPGISAVTPVDFRKFKHEAMPIEMVEN
jgi:chromosome segregation protein